MTTQYKKWLNLPFDQFSRQVQVYETINALRSSNKEAFKLVDMGGYKGVTRALHTNDDVTVLDVFDVKEEGYIKGDGTKTPFQNNEFDFALSFDVLEHIKQEQRVAFLKESARIAKRGVIAAFPQKNDANEFAEKSLDNYYKTLHGERHRWLKEHIDFAIPSQKDIESTLQKLGMKTLTMSSNDVELWLLMQGAMFLTSKYLEIGGSGMSALNSYYNKELGAFDTLPGGMGSYRKIIVGLKNDNDYTTVKAWLGTRQTDITNGDKLKVIEELNVFYLSLMNLSGQEKKQIEKERKKAEQASKVQQENNVQLLQEIENIRNSKTYRLAQKMQSAKHRLSKMTKGN
ncbi:MAG TPA: methyltransferase domain-containing protein [Candidatus Limnocylindria bacterium]|nr:methyltransferase domain-containing protein [Candidatus Limnocylindria bacterium]